jgi:hypothetical protein
MAKRFGGVKGDTKRPPSLQMEEYVQKAKAMFGDLGLHQDFEELDSVIGRTGSRPSDL